jgi:photosystem II stability/assembly factor-like uncharacterized protein
VTNFIDPQNGWLVVATDTNAEALMRTSDGGRTWSTVDPHLPDATTYAGSPTLTFVDTSHGFWATGSALFTTSDGGATWSVVKTAT